MAAVIPRLMALGHSVARALRGWPQQAMPAAVPVVSCLDASVVLDGDVSTTGAIVIEGHVAGDVVAGSVTLVGTGAVSGCITLTKS